MSGEAMSAAHRPAAIIVMAGLLGLALQACSAPSAQRALPTMVVHKTPSCGCCEKWVSHLRQAGFTLDVRNIEDTTAERAKAGVPTDLASCHTGVVDGYAVEGHVPAALIKRMLQERPKIAGIAAPGMPVGSPGMEQPGYGEPFDVVAFDASGKRSVYERVTPK
jgi:hypothetical protein